MKQVTMLSTGLSLVLWAITFLATIVYSFITVIDTQTLNIFVTIGMVISGVVSYGLCLSMDILDKQKVWRR